MAEHYHLILLMCSFALSTQFLFVYHLNSLHLQNEMFLMKVKSMLNTILNEIKMLNCKKLKSNLVLYYVAEMVK